MYDGLDDPVVKYYDFTLSTCDRVEIDYYLEHARNADGAIVDLCCGTGILSMEIARLGKTVYAVDSSDFMQRKLREKIEAEGVESIRVIRADMRDFSIDGKAGLCVCRDAFFHNLTPEAQRATLRSVNACLAPGGGLVFNIHYPNPRYLLWVCSDEARAFKPRGDYHIPGTDLSIRISQSVSGDIKRQVVKTALRYETIDREGNVIKEELSGWESRFTYPYEMWYLLELEGFKVERVYGDYRKAEYDIDTMLVIEARKAAR
jgi:SAM-dependent methyltransferase